MIKKITFLFFYLFMLSCAHQPPAPSYEEKPYLGLTLDDKIKKMEGSEACKTAFVISYVYGSSPAASAGLKVEQLLYKVNDECIEQLKWKSAHDFYGFIRKQKVGADLKLSVIENSISGEVLIDNVKTKEISSFSRVNATDYLHGDRRAQSLKAEWKVTREYKNIQLKVGNWFSYFNSADRADYDQDLLQLEKTFGSENVLRPPKEIAEKTKELESLAKLLTETASRHEVQKSGLVYSLLKKPELIKPASDKILRLSRNVEPNRAPEALTDLLETVLPIKSANAKKSKSVNSPLYRLAADLNEAQKSVQRSLSNLTESERKEAHNKAADFFKHFPFDQYVGAKNYPSENAEVDFFNQLYSKVTRSEQVAAVRQIEHLFSEKELQIIQQAARAWLDGKKSRPYTNSFGTIAVFNESEHEHLQSELPPNTILIIDLGGNDRYADINVPIIDFSGNDRYEAAADWRTGAAYFNLNFLIDVKGDDDYIGRSGAYGASLLGVSVFVDLSGNDQYRCHRYCLGSSVLGLSYFVDASGDDRYEAMLASQGASVAGGWSLFFDLKGRDLYFGHGLIASSYRDEGQFSSWSQGVALGLRGMVSGGFALLYDGGGEDEFEGGTFSQGGGYYYGIGIFINDGNEKDFYRGSRYTQGFSAHQAVGLFNELGGDDTYSSNSDVGTGMSWDLGVTLFEDHNGNDTYKTCVHCLGTAAQSGLTYFIDYGGADRYTGPFLPYKNDVENNYHDIPSLGVFWDRGGQTDLYEGFQNNSKYIRKKYQILIDE